MTSGRTCTQIMYRPTALPRRSRPPRRPSARGPGRRRRLGPGRSGGRRRAASAAAGTVRRPAIVPGCGRRSGRRSGPAAVPPRRWPRPGRCRRRPPTGRAGRLSPIFGRSGTGRGCAGRVGPARAGRCRPDQWRCRRPPRRRARRRRRSPGRRSGPSPPGDPARDRPRPPREPRRLRLGVPAPSLVPALRAYRDPGRAVVTPRAVSRGRRVPAPLDVTGVAVCGDPGDSAGTSTGCPVAPSDIDIPFPNFS